MINEEIRNRIKVAAAAYAYEVMNDPIMSDAAYDALALKIQPEVKTGNDVLDNFFATKYDPNTGSWVHQHPDIGSLKRVLAFWRAGLAWKALEKATKDMGQTMAECDCKKQDVCQSLGYCEAEDENP
jgi:hypothetical protein